MVLHKFLLFNCNPMPHDFIYTLLKVHIFNH